jgi:hypothetical protein
MATILGVSSMFSVLQELALLKHEAALLPLLIEGADMLPDSRATFALSDSSVAFHAHGQPVTKHSDSAKGGRSSLVFKLVVGM